LTKGEKSVAEKRDELALKILRTPPQKRKPLGKRTKSVRKRLAKKPRQ
jgi:hypothetical protein